MTHPLVLSGPFAQGAEVNIVKPSAISDNTHTIKTLIRLDGPIAEFGVYNGGNIWRLAELGRQVWAFDTFEGLPAEDYTQELDSGNAPGKFKPEHDMVEFFKTIPNVVVCKGRFVDTLPTIPAGVVFACIYLDADYYSSIKQVLEYLDAHGHIGPGTLIVTDDYGSLPGTTKAIDEWRGERPIIDNKVIWYE